MTVQKVGFVSILMLFHFVSKLFPENDPFYYDGMTNNGVTMEEKYRHNKSMILDH